MPVLGFCVLGLAVAAWSQPIGRMSTTVTADRNVGASVQAPAQSKPVANLDAVETNSAQVDQFNVVDAEAVWRDWMDRNGVVQSSLAIGFGSEIIHSVGQRRSAQSAYPMASLSKAVTGLCLNQLLNDTAYTWDSTLRDLQPEWAKINFTPAVEMADVTLSQLATHTSGLPKVLDYGTASTRAVNLSSQSTMTRAALREPSNFGDRGGFGYSNANYAILGTLIEAMTGEAYADHCGAQILAPAGATGATVTGRMAQTAGYGGWSVSVDDYARFVMHWFDQSQPWMIDPTDFPYDPNSKYGMGARMHTTQHGMHVGHTGRWTHNDPQWPNIGALFFKRADGVVAVVSWNSSLDYEAYDELVDLLYQAL